MNFILLKNFIDIDDLKRMKKDIEIDFKKNIHKDVLKSGLQTKPDLHIIHNEPHWDKYYKKLNNIMFKMNKKKITKSWSLKIIKNEKNFFHKHQENSFTSVFFLQNDDYFLGTHLKDKEEFIIPGYENSLLIFDGNILHDAVFPSYKLKKPRYTIITDYE